MGWNALAVVVALVGVVLLATTLDPLWVVLLLISAAATGLSVGPVWFLLIPAGISAAGWVLALVRQTSQVDQVSSQQTVVWAAPFAAVVLVFGLSFLVRRRLMHERSEVARAVAFAQDVAVHDPLTGLTNRRGLALLGGQILESARRRGDAVYCIFVDVDGLSRVNEELGHASGDDVLLTVAEGLRRSTRATDAVARWGNDQFVVVGPGTGLAPLEMERRIRAHCVEHTSIDQRIWQARVSAGGAVLEPWDDGTVDTMLRVADREMHLRRALRREAGAPAYRPSRLDQSPQRPHPRHPGGRQD